MHEGSWAEIEAAINDYLAGRKRGINVTSIS